MLDFFYPMDPFSHYVAGVDEVGRGPLVGNVVTAAVILDPARPIEGLNDSKKLSEKKREALSSVILENALADVVFPHPLGPTIKTAPNASINKSN